MSTIKRFEDLEIWQEARRLTKEILVIGNSTGLKNNYELKRQINSASGSVMDNIAEGFERDGNVEFRHFLSIAKGSAGEVRSQLYRCYDCGYLVEEQFVQLVSDYEILNKRIASFISYLNKNDYKGLKYKEN